MTTVYHVLPVAKVAADLMRDLNDQGKPFAVIRSSATSKKVWGFYASEKLAKAACRRWIAREVRTP